MTVDDYWEKIEKCGWLENVSEEKRDEVRKTMEKLHQQNPQWIYLGLATGSFDAEYIEDDASYPTILEAYTEASNGVFAPQNVESFVDWENEKATVAFDLRGKHFKIKVPCESDYFEERVHRFINKALAETGFEERFFDLPPIDQIAYLVFVKPELYRKAVEEGLIPKS